MGTVSVIEALWTLAALVGLVSWARSAADAGRTMRAVKSRGIVNGRRTVARLATGLTRTMVMIELVFLSIGVLSMTRPPTVGSTELSRLIVGGALIGASVGITVLAFRWRRAEEYLLRESERRVDERAALAADQAAQVIREAALASEYTAQLIRSAAQDVHGVAQDARDERQSARGKGQDAYGRELNEQARQQDKRGAEQDGNHLQ